MTAKVKLCALDPSAMDSKTQPWLQILVECGHIDTARQLLDPSHDNFSFWDVSHHDCRWTCYIDVDVDAEVRHVILRSHEVSPLLHAATGLILTTSQLYTQICIMLLRDTFLSD